MLDPDFAPCSSLFLFDKKRGYFHAGHSRGTDPNKTFADAICAQPDDRRPGSSPPQIDS